MEKYITLWPLEDYSNLVIAGVYATSMTLVSLLHDRNVHEIFGRACAILYYTAQHFPLCRYILEGLKALAWSLKLTLPPKVLQYIENVGLARENYRDIPLAFAIPQHDSIRGILSGGDDDLAETSTQLGGLLSKWSAIYL
jgi:hypothetical protein